MGLIWPSAWTGTVYATRMAGRGLLLIVLMAWFWIKPIRLLIVDSFRAAQLRLTAKIRTKWQS